jgi:hypothetical protein
MGARIFQLRKACDRCGDLTPIGDLTPCDDHDGIWCIDCITEQARAEYWREPEINPER